MLNHNPPAYVQNYIAQKRNLCTTLSSMSKDQIILDIKIDGWHGFMVCGQFSEMPMTKGVFLNKTSTVFCSYADGSYKCDEVKVP